MRFARGEVRDHIVSVWRFDRIKVWREAAQMAVSPNLLQITSVDLMHPQEGSEPDLAD